MCKEKELVRNAYKAYSQKNGNAPSKLYLKLKGVDYRLLQPKRNLNLLDVGCCLPIDPILLAKQYGCSVTGIDFSEEIINKGKEWVKNEKLDSKVHLVLHDITKPFPFKDNSFDCTYSFSVIEHIPDKAERQNVIENMVRVTRGEGIIVIVTTNLLCLHYVLFSEIKQMLGIAHYGYEGYVTPHWLKKMCKRHGLRIELFDADDVTRFGFLPKIFGARMGVRCTKL
jgi:ubiquinone/menaquinone biosynthesis C-methylase UbiE